MISLAIELSSAKGSLALKADNTIYQHQFNNPRAQVKEILPAITQLLDKAKLNIAELEYLIISAGPGSFTGLRIGLGVAQGLALASQLPIVTVSSLQVLAQTAYQLHSVENSLCLVNAYMQELYVGCYTLSAEQIMLPTQSDSKLLAKQFELANYADMTPVGDAWLSYPELISDNTTIFNCYPQASALAVLGEQAYRGGEVSSAEQVELNYLRGKEAWQKAS